MIQNYIEDMRRKPVLKSMRNSEQHIRKIKSAMERRLHQWALWKKNFEKGTFLKTLKGADIKFVFKKRI